MKKTRGRKPKQQKDEHWGIRLASVLKERGLSNRAVAKIIGVSPTVVSAWIRLGSSPADMKVIKKMADALETDFCFLLTGERSLTSPKANITELFQETPYFDGYARIRIDRLTPRSGKNEE
jgi:transcriptional regulator with XRE-family HTH domain